MDPHSQLSLDSPALNLNFSSTPWLGGSASSAGLRPPTPTLEVLAADWGASGPGPGPITAAFNAAAAAANSTRPAPPMPPLPTASFSAGLSPKLPADLMMSPGISSGLAGTFPAPAAAAGGAREGAAATATLTELFMSPEYATPSAQSAPQQHHHQQTQAQQDAHYRAAQQSQYEQQQQYDAQYRQHEYDAAVGSTAVQQQPGLQPVDEPVARRPAKKARTVSGAIPAGIMLGSTVGTGLRGIGAAELQAGSAVEEAQRAAALKAERFADERKLKRKAEASIAKRPEVGDGLSDGGSGDDGAPSEGDVNLPPDELRKKRYLRRLELNRQSAAVSRVRRREYVKELEDKLVGVEKEKYKLQSQVDSMGNENLKLRAQMKALQSQLAKPPVQMNYVPMNGGGGAADGGAPGARMQHPRGRK